MKIVINIPKGYKDAEIVINIGTEESLPFDDALTNEEAVKELTPYESEKLNAFGKYLEQNMGNDLDIYDDTPPDNEFGGDIDIG